MLGTALESNFEVPEMEVVAEGLLHEEYERKDAKQSSDSVSRNQSSDENALRI